MSNDLIKIRGDDESGWAVYINGNGIGTFVSWQEARELCERLKLLLAEQDDR